VFYGRYDNFLELLPYYKHLDIDTPDERGWTLLHIAASEGHDSICKHLLSLGADWQRKSSEFSSRFSYHIPDSLHGGCWTPAEVARAESTERYEKFIAIVEASQRKGNTHGAILNEPDLWFDAPEALII
jgi:ankyrin repeat protein